MFQLCPQRLNGYALQRRAELVERRVQVTGQVSTLRGTEQPLGAPVAIGGQPRRLLEGMGGHGVGALAASSRGHALESLGDRVVGAGGGVDLVPQALLTADRAGKRAVREAALGGQRRVGDGGARELVAERHARRVLPDEPCPLRGIERAEVEAERRACPRDGLALAATG
jgi:hypothetical protein